MEVDTINVIKLVKRINGPNFVLGAHKFPKIKYKCPLLITNNLRSTNDQRLNFDTLAVFWMVQIDIKRDTTEDN